VTGYVVLNVRYLFAANVVALVGSDGKLVALAGVGVVGGFAGALLSGLAALGLWAVTPIGLDVVLVARNGWYLLGGVVFGVGVALVSGAYPAWKAASERPVEALRG
jgi:putative ABC transport system permease protein